MKRNIIGFCGMWLVIDAAQITNVAVVERMRGQKIGEAFMREAMRVAREANMDVMSLEVRVTNDSRTKSLSQAWLPRWRYS